MYQFDSGIPVASYVHGIAGALEAPGEEILDALFVLNDQYSHRLRPGNSINGCSVDRLSGLLNRTDEPNNRSTDELSLPIRLLGCHGHDYNDEWPFLARCSGQPCPMDGRGIERVPVHFGS